MEMPYMKFYPRDWQGEQGLQRLSYAARGLWIELICLMATGTRYGYLENAGRILTTAEIARMTRGDTKEVEDLLMQLDEQKVLSRDNRGCICCRRMLREAHIREVRQDAGKKRWQGHEQLHPPTPPISENTDNIDTRVQIPDTRYHTLHTLLHKQNDSNLHEQKTHDVITPIGCKQFTVEDCKAASVTIAMLPEMIQDFFNHYNRQGWVLANGRPIVNLASAMAKWKKDQPSHGKQERGALKEESPRKRSIIPEK